MRVKTCELQGAALDWAVAQALDYDVGTEGAWSYEQNRDVVTRLYGGSVPGRNAGDDTWSPSTLWEQGGPIIDREKLTLLYYTSTGLWEAGPAPDTYIDQYPGDDVQGPTALIAAMRWLVINTFGDEIEIPENLL